jgi:alanyl-tRNA synthetase
MEAKVIRKTFLEFFESKGHQIVDSAPLVIKNDPTLLFTNAGMNQFKDFFLGDKVPENRRVADTQKCLRVSGKHNDLEEVGIDTYHHTLFEMLGNWSFGDYFKEESINWAWELLVDVYGLPEDRLYATVFGGDKEDGLQTDQEAIDIWKKILPEERILECSKKDNFWEMGDTGPCGPCSEIHIDLRSDEERAKIPGRDLVNEDNPLVIEIWNLVFIQFQRMSDKSLVELPEKHIDTGMGFERLALAIQGKKSNYDTDVFGPLIAHVSGKSGVEYGKEEKTDIAIRVIVDHVRAVTFAIADGQLPSNNGAGYVIRRILRRAVRYGYTFLGFDSPFIYELVNILGGQFAEVFPEIEAQKDFISKVIEEEETSFLRTLTTGIKRLDSIITQTPSGSSIPGEVVFELYDTYGFPVDLTALIARENGFDIDEEGFKKAMDVQKNRAREASASTSGDWNEVNSGLESQFVGYDDLISESRIIKYREVKDKKGSLYQVVLDQTPFYPEGGGQVGDTGFLASEGKKFSVLDTKKENDLIIHILKELPEQLDAAFQAVVSTSRRNDTSKNHTSTHLLQSALKAVLGDHVQQKGSLVNEKLLRFDFSHFTKMAEDEIAEVERIVNNKIRENILLDEQRSIPIQEAMEAGATALFGEKYGDSVRMITFDPEYSRELCGGTHVQATGEIGLFKIISESSVAAGVRRIEAITAERADKFVSDKIEVLEQVNELLKAPKDTVKAVESLIKDKEELIKKLDAFKAVQTKMLKEELEKKIEVVSDLNVLIQRVEVDSSESLRQIAFDLRKKVDQLVMILAADVEGKPMIAAMLSDSVVEKGNLNAGNLVRELAKEIKGGGGGQPFFATAGGKDVAGLDNVVKKAREIVLN